MRIIDDLRSPLSLSHCATCVNIGGGEVNHVFKLTDGERQFAVKWLGDDDFTGIDRREQYDLQSQLAKQGIAPAPCFLNEAQTLWVERWVDVPAKPQSGALNLADLANGLARVHTLNIHAAPLNLSKRWQHYIAKAGLPAQHPLVKQAHTLIVQHSLDASAKGQWVLCHNDLSYGHLVDPAHPVIVDWEYAAWGNRYFDLVACAHINRLDAQQSHQLCCFYAQRLQLAESEVIAGFFEQQAVVTVTEQLWYAAFEAQQKG